MLTDEVSGKKKVSTASEKPLSQRSSQIVQVQPSAWAAKPPIRGPRTGPQTALMPHTPMAYALFCGAYISAREAPPFRNQIVSKLQTPGSLVHRMKEKRTKHTVASAGDPKKPVKNRNAKRVPRFLANAAGTCSATNTIRVEMYIGFLPT